MRLVSHRMSDLQEAYTSLTEKTLAFLGAATSLYDARYIVKIDDDVFLRADRLPFAFTQWDEVHAGGCLASRICTHGPHMQCTCLMQCSRQAASSFIWCRPSHMPCMHPAMLLTCCWAAVRRLVWLILPAKVWYSLPEPSIQAVMGPAMLCRLHWMHEDRRDHEEPRLPMARATTRGAGQRQLLHACLGVTIYCVRQDRGCPVACQSWNAQIFRQ